jgi:tetratricopeptide (TPR) repeat protein
MHISSRNLGFFGVCLIMLTLALPAVAQNRIIKGKVTDDKGQAVVGASIVIQAVDSKARKFNTKTDKKGAFVYMGIPAGNYHVIVRAKGFAPDYKSPIRPMIQSDTSVDFVLTPGDQNLKLPIELSAEELEQLKQELQKAEQRKQVAADVQALFDSGLQLSQQGKDLEAIEEYKKALEMDPEQTNIMGNMAESYAKLGKNDEALDIYKKAVVINPKDAALYTNMGVILGKMGKNEESKEAFEKAAALNPASSAQNFYNIGATMVNNGRTAEAADAFRQAIAADANFAEAYYQLGMCLSGSQETMPDAIKSLQKYVQIGKKPDQIEVAKQIIAALEQSLKK